MTSIFKKPRPSQPRGRNGFDMSFHRSFTAPCGMLLPVAKDFANPGDKYKLNSSLFIRTEALQSAAFQKFKGHVEWFFVPAEQLFSLWPEFFYSTNDNNSTAFALTGATPILPTFNLLPFVKDASNLSTWNTTSKAYTGVDEFGTPYAFNFRRLWDLFGYGSLSRFATPTALNLPLLDFLAYHRIFYSHYALTDWTPQKNSMFNVDTYYNSVPPLDACKNIVSTIHYRPWRKDFFTNIMPQPMFGSSFANFLSGGYLANTLPYNKERYNDADYTFQHIASVEGDNSYSHSTDVQLIAIDGADDSRSRISVADLRTAFAMDKLLRITAFAGSHYNEQTLAHFGYKMPQGISKEVYVLGSQTMDVTIGEVVSTASTGVDGAGGTLGDIAGKGFGVSKNEADLSFECPCHGYIMAIFSLEPIQTYASIGMNPVNRYSGSVDFYHSEFDNLGMQPLLAATYDVANGITNNKCFGWQYRWSELKTNSDVVNESFWDTDKSTWVATKQDPFQSVQTWNNTVNTYFYIDPKYANSIFMQNFNVFSSEVTPTTTRKWTETGWNSIQCYSGDQFLIDADFKIYKTSIMSVHSLPQL